jgi:hypothetical protein
LNCIGDYGIENKSMKIHCSILPLLDNQFNKFQFEIIERMIYGT